MFKNYLKTAFRNLAKNKVFSAINIAGLTIGISATLVILMVVYYEFSFDTYQPGRNNIYRVVIDAKFNGTEGHSTGVPAPLGPAIRSEIPGVDKTIPIFQFQGDADANVTVSNTKGDETVYKKQPNIVFTNGDYFSIAPHTWVAGSPQQAMADPFSVVLSESRASLYFPSVAATNVVGKKITYNNDLTVTVSGVVKDLHENTTFTAVEFISLATIAKTGLNKNFMMDVWDDWMAYSQLYVKLLPSTNAAHTEALLKTLIGKYNPKVNKDDNNSMALHLQPLNDVHFNSLYPGIGQRLAHKPTLYGLLVIAGFILMLGCINFINLTTAKASQRAKEIGIRKTMGSSRKQLAWQFLSETFYITLIAAVLSFFALPLVLQLFADFLPPGLSFHPLSQPYIFVFLLFLVLLVSILAGFYPALVLSAYRPVAVLKNKVLSSGESRHSWVRRLLTVFQFVIAQFFIIVTVLVSKQISYSMNSDLGFNKDAIITFDLPRRDTVASHGQNLMNAINAMPGVSLASSGFLSPADKGVAFTNISYPEMPELQASVQIRWGDPDYFKVYKLSLLAGRNVQASDTTKEFVINNTYAKLLGFQNPEDALGKELRFNDRLFPIVGVMKDFHDQSTHAAISPIVFTARKGSTFHVRLNAPVDGAQSWQHTIADIEKAYKQIYPEGEFNYKFFDETIAGMYENELRTASLLKWATGITIFISCLGLLGLVIFTINTRVKEIGIRKTLGASVAQIVSVLSTDFMRLVFVAFVIASPLAWWASFNWLQDFAFRTSISWWVFLVSGSAMMLLALLTLSFQTIKVAVANPVQSLRTE